MTPIKKVLLREMANAMKFVWNDYIDERSDLEEYFVEIGPQEAYLQRLNDPIDGSISDKICIISCLPSETVASVITSAEKMITSNKLRTLNGASGKHIRPIRKYTTADRISFIYIPADKIEYVGNRIVYVPGLGNTMGDWNENYHEFWKFLANRQDKSNKNGCNIINAKLLIRDDDFDEVILILRHISPNNVDSFMHI